MKLSPQDIAEYQKIYEHIHGETISEEEAETQGMRLIGLIQSITDSLTRKQQNL